MRKSLIAFIAIGSLFLLMGCSQVLTKAQPQTTHTQMPTQTLSAAPTQIAAKTQAPAQSPTAVQTELQASDAAKAAADADASGAPYFVAYEYDAINYMVSAYQNQQSPGNYSGGGAIYLVNKTTGKVTANSQVDLSKVDFSKFLAVYSKLSGKIIE